MRTFGLALVLLLIATLASAQTANGANHLRWDELAQSVATANSATFPVYKDGATTSTGIVASVVCAASVAPLNPATDATCDGNFPAFTPGSHTLAITELLSGAESAKSNTITFQFVVSVVPTQLRIVRLLGGAFKGSVFTSRGRQHLLRGVDIHDFHRIN